MGQSDSGYKGPRAFVEFSEELADGHFAADSSRELQRVITECHERAVTENKVGKGKLTIELAIAIDPRGQAAITYAHKLKLPPRATALGQAWITKDGLLTSVHPKQLEISGTERKRRAEPLPAAPRRGEDPQPEEAEGDDDDLH